MLSILSDFLNLNKFFSNILLYNKETNTYILAKLGYSWTLFFSIIAVWWIVPFFRKDYKYAFALFLIQSIVILIIFSVPSQRNIVVIMIPYIAFFILSFLYNKIYLTNLLKKGYKVIDYNKNIDIEQISELVSYPVENIITNSEYDKKGTYTKLKKENITRFIITGLVYLAYVYLLNNYINISTN